ncbi:hypothetical protein LCGC14_1983150 [marine sediment metagenome]|uniref:HNH nuclease domain-containing protein n=1 Tax=marine sediment metagenome TaxID=412755 RepID=A0A0F9FWF2_9ZZZZ
MKDEHQVRVRLMTGLKVPVKDRFWTKANKTDTCWLWTANLDECGYRRISMNRIMRGAHRISYQMIVGEIPEGLEIDHLCRVRHCVNPDHLEVVTHKANTERSVHRNSLKVECQFGHPFDKENTYNKGDGSRGCRICCGTPLACQELRRIPSIPNRESHIA